LSPEIIDRAFKQQDPSAMREVADAIIRMVNAAVNRLGIREKYGYEIMNDFRGQTLAKLFDYSLERFDPEKAQLSTFIFTHVGNEWKNFQNQLIRRLQREQSIETPVGENLTLGDIIEDLSSADFVSAQEAAGMYEELKGALRDPRYQEIFRLWVDDTALNEELEALGLPVAEQARNAKQKADDIAQVINSKFPDKPLSPVRVNRVIHDVVKEQVRQKFPEEAAWAESTFQPTQEQVPTTPIEDDEEPYIPIEERPAPIYRIDPETGERTRIALNLRRRKALSANVRYAHDMWFNMLMTWMSMELNGKLR